MASNDDNSSRVEPFVFEQGEEEELSREDRLIMAAAASVFEEQGFDSEQLRQLERMSPGYLERHQAIEEQRYAVMKMETENEKLALQTNREWMKVENELLQEQLKSDTGNNRLYMVLSFILGLGALALVSVIAYLKSWQGAVATIFLVGPLFAVLARQINHNSNTELKANVNHGTQSEE